MRNPRAINLVFFLLSAIVCATSLRHQTYPAEDYAPNNSSRMRIEDFIRNQQAITANGWGEIGISDAMFESDGTPTSSHEAHQVSLASLLSGYYVTAVYADDKCTTLVSAVAYELNTCIAVKYYFPMNAATADAESETQYSDILCTAKEELSSYIDYTASCATMSKKRSTLAFVNSNGVLPSSPTMASIRLVKTIIFFERDAQPAMSMSASFLTVFDLILYHAILYRIVVYHNISYHIILR